MNNQIYYKILLNTVNGFNFSGKSQIIFIKPNKNQYKINNNLYSIHKFLTSPKNMTILALFLTQIICYLF